MSFSFAQPKTREQPEASRNAQPSLRSQPARKQLKPIVKRQNAANAASVADASTSESTSVPGVDVTTPSVSSDERTCAIPAPITGTPGKFSFADAANYASRDEDDPIIARSGATMDDMVCDMPRAVFNGSDARVPPGSHYENWVWNALDKPDPGFTTIELHVDGARDMSDEVLDALGEPRPRVLRARGSVAFDKPVYDADKHCLMSIPTPRHAPWGAASRVLLIPMSYHQVPIPESRYRSKVKPKFGQAVKNQAPKMSNERDPAAIRDWLTDGFDQRVIFGYCTISDRPEHVGDNLWWVVVSLEDAQRLHQMQGYASDGDVYEIEPRKDRYLGWWADSDACEALRAAYRGKAAVMPDDWPAEDVEFVASHRKSRPRG